MLPLVEYPELVQHYAPIFEDVFSADVRGSNSSVISAGRLCLRTRRWMGSTVCS